MILINFIHFTSPKIVTLEKDLEKIHSKPILTNNDEDSNEKPIFKKKMKKNVAMETNNNDDKNKKHLKRSVLITSEVINTLPQKTVDEEKSTNIPVKTINKMSGLLDNINAQHEEFKAAIKELGNLFNNIEYEKSYEKEKEKGKEKGSERLDVRIIEVSNDKKKDKKE